MAGYLRVVRQSPIADEIVVAGIVLALAVVIVALLAWRRARDQLELRVELFVRETKRLRAGIQREARRLGEFMEAPIELEL